VPPYTENRPGGITTVIECACVTSATGWMTSCRLASVMGSKNYSSLYLIILHFEIFSDSILPLKHTKTKLAEPQTESHLVSMTTFHNAFLCLLISCGSICERRLADLSYSERRLSRMVFVLFFTC